MSAPIFPARRDVDAEDATGRWLRLAEEADPVALERDEGWFQIAATCDENEFPDEAVMVRLSLPGCVPSGLATALLADMLVVDMECPPATDLQSVGQVFG